MDSKLVSVIIPTYNRAEFLREAITSVLAQTYSNFELLILDNCSADHTPEVVASFTDPRIKYLRHQCNIGPTANWSYGVYWAKGEYLSILGDDDRYKLDFLAHRVSLMSSDSAVVSAFGPFEYWDGGQDLSGRISHPEIDMGDSHVLDKLQAAAAAHNVQFVGATLYRTPAVHAVWPRAWAGGKCGDSLLNNLLIVEGGKTAYFPQSDLLYRCHAGQDMAINHQQIAEDGKRMYMILLEMAKDRDFKKLYRSGLVVHLNRYGRQFWDTGHSALAAVLFWDELKVSPTRLITWLRLLRCYTKILLDRIKP